MPSSRLPDAPPATLSLKLTSGLERSPLVASLTTLALAGADMRLLLHISIEFESMSLDNRSNSQDQNASDKNFSPRQSTTARQAARPPRTKHQVWQIDGRLPGDEANVCWWPSAGTHERQLPGGSAVVVCWAVLDGQLPPLTSDRSLAAWFITAMLEPADYRAGGQRAMNGPAKSAAWCGAHEPPEGGCRGRCRGLTPRRGGQIPSSQGSAQATRMSLRFTNSRMPAADNSRP